MNSNKFNDIEELKNRVRILEASIEEKDQQLEEQIYKNLELEEKISSQSQEIDEKDKENFQLLKALEKVQEAFGRIQESFETKMEKVDEDFEVKEKIIQNFEEILTSKNNEIQNLKDKLQTALESYPNFTLDTSTQHEAHQTLAWDDFCEKFDEIPSFMEHSEDLKENLIDLNSTQPQNSTSTRSNTLKPSKSESFFIQCRFCDKILPSKKSLLSHMEIHKQKCKICQKSFAKKFSLKFHMKSHKN